MKRKILLVVLVASLAMNLAVFFTIGGHWLGYRGFHRPSKDSSWHIKRMNKMLDLSDAQAKAMEQNHQVLEQEVKPLQASLHSKKMELFTLMKSADAYTPQIDSLIGQTAAIQMDIEKHFVRNSFEIKKILTPEQLKKFEAMIEKGFRKTHHGEPGPGPDRGPQEPGK